MPIPQSAREALLHRLEARRRGRWPKLSGITVRFRGSYAYVEGVLRGGGSLPLCRLHYHGSPDAWGFAMYLASKGRYETSMLPSGTFTGTPEEALDCACGLYLRDPSAWRFRPQRFSPTD